MAENTHNVAVTAVKRPNLPLVGASSGGGADRPTVGQLWPRLG